MTQRQITSFVATGQVPPCARCKHYPKHFLDGRRSQAGGGHFIECPPCGFSTDRHAAPERAIAEWRELNGYTQSTRWHSGIISPIRQRGCA